MWYGRTRSCGASLVQLCVSDLRQVLCVMNTCFADISVEQHVKLGRLRDHADRLVCTPWLVPWRLACWLLRSCCAVIQVMVARGYQSELWAELALPTPSQARLDSICRAMQLTMAEAHDTFKHLLRLNPNGVVAMRRYAAFLIEVGLSLPPLLPAQLELRWPESFSTSLKSVYSFGGLHYKVVE